MTGPPDDLPPELLAGYADGELPPPLRARVEAWLAAHPEFLADLEAQEALGPGNVEFWRAVRVPSPSRRDWAGLAVRLRVPAGGLGRWAGAAALLAAAAALAIVFVGNPPCGRDAGPPVLCPAAGGSADDHESFPMARADEVRYLSLPESAAPLLVGSDHPVKEPLLVLARADEVSFHGMGCDPAGRFPEDPLTTDPPVIWTPAPRDLCPE